MALIDTVVVIVCQIKTDLLIIYILIKALISTEYPLYFVHEGVTKMSKYTEKSSSVLSLLALTEPRHYNILSHHYLGVFNYS